MHGFDVGDLERRLVRAEISAAAIPWADRKVARHGVLRGKQDEKTYCLTEKCSQDVERCLTKHAPVASLASGRATAPLPFHNSMLTDVGPVALWATPLRRPSAAANPQGASRPLDER